MTEQIIIDGVNVAECPHYEYLKTANMHICNEVNGLPRHCIGYDCLYKQLQRLKAENEELKQEVKDIGTNFIKKGDYSRKLENKLKSEKLLKENAMQEASKYAIKCGEYKTALEEIRKYCNECNLKADDTACEILAIIDEVLRNEEQRK